MKLLGDIGDMAAIMVIRSVRQLRADLAGETDDTIKVSLQLMIDELLAELNRRNTVVLTERATKAAAS